MNCLLVPTLAFDLSLLDRLADSVDYPIKHKVIINNGRPGALKEWKVRHPGWKVLTYRHNIGVSASWNLAPMLWPDEDSWLICNDDVTFHSGMLELTCDTSDQLGKTNPIIYLNNTHPFCVFVWTQKGVRDWGFFDENLWPAYYEDYDMRQRFRIAGVKHVYVQEHSREFEHGKGNRGQNYNAVMEGCGLFNRDYYVRKWGTLNETPVFQTPFNKSVGLGHWQLEVEKRAQRMALWDTFISNPGASFNT